MEEPKMKDLIATMIKVANYRLEKERDSTISEDTLSLLSLVLKVNDDQIAGLTGEGL